MQLHVAWANPRFAVAQLHPLNTHAPHAGEPRTLAIHTGGGAPICESSRTDHVTPQKRPWPKRVVCARRRPLAWLLEPSVVRVQHLLLLDQPSHPKLKLSGGLPAFAGFGCSSP